MGLGRERGGNSPYQSIVLSAYLPSIPCFHTFLPYLASIPCFHATSPSISPSRDHCNPLSQQLIQIGIRTATPEQRAVAVLHDVETIEARHFPSHGSALGPILSKWIGNETLVYITFDMDSLDPVQQGGWSNGCGGGSEIRWTGK